MANWDPLEPWSMLSDVLALQRYEYRHTFPLTEVSCDHTSFWLFELWGGRQCLFSFNICWIAWLIYWPKPRIWPRVYSLRFHGEPDYTLTYAEVPLGIKFI
nr:hypothetical protein [Morchella crassipes]